MEVQNNKSKFPMEVQNNKSKFPTARFESEKTSFIDDTQIVKVTQYKARPVADVMTIKGLPRNNLKDYEKISKNVYRNKITGELHQYTHSEFRSEKSIKRSMRQFEKILLNNFSGADDELFVTLTTKKDITEVSKMKQYYKGFWKKVKKDYPDLEYALVYEMHQERNSLHMHVMFKNMSQDKLNISNDKMERYWNRGKTHTTRITTTPSFFVIDEERVMSGECKPVNEYNIDKLISYMCKYHTKENVPAGGRLYSTSRNMKLPGSTKMRYSKFKKEFHQGNSKLIDGYTTKIISNFTNETINEILKQRWIKNKH